MSNWVNAILDKLSVVSHWSYQEGGVIAAEPMALAALALAAHGRLSEAQSACDQLTRLQAGDGSVGITAEQATPCWPTGWAVLAWSIVQSLAGGARYRDRIEPALNWLLSLHGCTCDPSSDMGHNTRLDGWPWVAGTHPWVEPTAINLLALKATGRGRHPRAREAVAMLSDRLLPEGGCNYGNTLVLGQALRPHIEPTGLALIALSGEADASGRIERSLTYLQEAVAGTSAGVSLAYGLMGLTAYDRRTDQADDWLAAAARKTESYRSSPLRMALLALAAAQHCPLIALTRGVSEDRLSTCLADAFYQ